MMRVFQGVAIEKNIELTRTFPTEPLTDVYADPLRIKQVLSNLLSNAIKFTDIGSVSLTLQQSEGPDNDSVHYIIDVRTAASGLTPASRRPCSGRLARQKTAVQELGWGSISVGPFAKAWAVRSR
jgi:signal transduction histidine kinase